MLNTRRAGTSGAVALVAAALCLTACSQKKDTTGQVVTSTKPPTSTVATQPAPTTSDAAAPAVLTVSAAKGSSDVNPVKPIEVAVEGGSLSAVTLTNAEGKAVKGSLSSDKQHWSSAEDLGYAKAYTLHATATNADGKRTTAASDFSTVTPANMTMPYIQTAAGGAITPGVKFGVGQVVRIHFDESIPNRAAAQAALKVTTVPAQTGAFSWLSDTDVYWRTKSYMKPGTKVTITASAYGKNFGNNLYGQADASTWFKVGDKHVSIADDNTKLVKVYTNDKLVKTMKTSMGRHTSVQGDTGPIDLRTNSGPHVVVGGEKNINMTSASFGLSKGANAYATTVPIGVRISYDGEYVHWAAWSVWAQGNTDTSHGCLNVSPADSYWFYDYSVPGDIVDVKNTGRNLAEWNSGYWNVSWAKWLSDSAKV